MGEPYPNRRRRRPRRRLPDRYRNDRPQVWPRSYMDFGFRHIWELIAPGIRGRDRRQLFNRLSTWNVLGMGLCGGFMGSLVAGPIGVILGFVVGIALSDHVMKKHRLNRP